MMHNIQYFTDRAFIEELPSDLYSAMKAQGLIAPGRRKVHFCGFFSWEGGVAVFLPMNSDIGVKPAFSAYLLLKAFNRYYVDKSTGVNDSSGQLLGGGLLSLAIALADDYLLNGLYLRRNRISTINQGKTNWAKTISRHSPFPSSSVPVYMDLESSRMQSVSNCETAKIHASVMKDIYNKFGVFIYGDECIVDSQLESLDVVPSPIEDRNTWGSYLSKELNCSYSERDIFLIKALLQYINGQHEGTLQPLIIGTQYFHSVWESMLNYSLSGIANYNHKLAVPYYLVDGFYHEVAEKGQRTDTVLRDDEHFAVVDAKYYSALSPKYAPGWPDIVKQLFYKKAVQDVEGSAATVTTHFVFPGKSGDLLSAHVSARGQHKSNVLDNSFGYSTIYCHYCEPTLLMQAYVCYRKLTCLRKEIFAVEERI